MVSYGGKKPKLLGSSDMTRCNEFRFTFKVLCLINEISVYLGIVSSPLCV